MWLSARDQHRIPGPHESGRCIGKKQQRFSLTDEVKPRPVIGAEVDAERGSQAQAPIAGPAQAHPKKYLADSVRLILCFGVWIKHAG